jgi:NDMA-dependent alcohol dehydrogenase
MSAQVESAAAARGKTEPYLRTKGALLWEIGSGRWEIEEIEFDEPKEGEVLVKLAATGLCHSDYHYQAGDGTLDALPLLGGHEGAGVVTELGPNVKTLAPGDHVITTFMPSCGRCHWCTIGRSNLCDRGAGLLSGLQLDGTSRVRTASGTPVAQMTYIGTFSPWIVCPEDSLIKIDPEVPLDKVCIVGCGVPTGWGSAVYLADVQPGDTVVVVGVGGVGINAVQGAKLAGASEIVVIEPVEWKRKAAIETFGATHAVADAAEAAVLVGDITRGVMADKTIVHQGVVDGQLLQSWLDLTSKGGVLAISGVSAMSQIDAKLSIFGLVLMEKQIRGGLYGSCNPRVDIPKIIDLYKRGDLKLDELVTRTYPLEEINQAYQDMVDGENFRGVVVFDD